MQFPLSPRRNYSGIRAKRQRKLRIKLGNKILTCIINTLKCYINSISQWCTCKWIMNECVWDNSPEDNKDLYTCNTCIGMMPIMLSVSVYQYFSPNFRLNDGGKSCMRSLKSFSSFLWMNFKNKGIMILMMKPTGDRKDLLYI